MMPNVKGTDSSAFSIYRLIQWSRVKMNSTGLSTMVLICIEQINEYH